MRKALSLLLAGTLLSAVPAGAARARARGAAAEEAPCSSAGGAEVSARTRGDARELRLGLVFYGGVSLAIYMHGQTREIRSLVAASRAHEAGWPPEKLDGTARVYLEALNDLAASRDGVKTRVIVDSIAGTSAGGINGIFLAKSLAHDQSEAELRDLWMEKADIWQLMGGRFEAGFRLARLAVGLPFGKARAPLDGDAMFRWVHEALEGMGTECQGASLVPPGERLRLFVTTTDFRGRPRGFAIGEPPAGREKEHRKVLELTFERNPDGTARLDPFARRDNAFLTFAARSTSSFPGAFPPVNLETIRRNIDAVGDEELERIRNQYFGEYRLDGSNVDHTWFVDGGVLDNYPFGHVVEDLRRRAPARQVERRVVYLQPDPGTPPGPPAPDELKYLSTIWGALSTIARSEPIGDDFRNVEDFNARVRLARDILERVREHHINDPDLDPVLGIDAAYAAGDPAREARRRRIETFLKTGAVLPYDAYLELRAQAVVEGLGRAASRNCRLTDGIQRTLLTAAIRRWAERRGLIGKDRNLDEQRRLHEQLDAGYLWRQLRFVGDAVNDMYDGLAPGGGLTREDLDQAQAALAEQVELARRLMRGEDVSRDSALKVATLCQAALALQPDGGLDAVSEAFLAEHAGLMDAVYEELLRHVDGRQREIRAAIERRYDELTLDWPPERRRELHRYYLGFPIWDLIVYPYQRLTDAGEFHTIQVVRMSPDDSWALGGASADEKLGGTKVGHFGAFFKRHRREQDYLWGRLDGADRILALIYGMERGTDAASPLRTPPAERLRAAFSAILEAEGPALPRAGRCVAALRQTIRAANPLPAGDRPIPEACRAR